MLSLHNSSPKLARLTSAQRCSGLIEATDGKIYDSDKNQLPYGGAVDINGRIVWAVAKEEEEEEDKATKERIKKAFFFAVPFENHHQLKCCLSTSW